MEMLGIILLGAVFLAAGLAGIAAFWVTWPRTSNTSPLAALVALVWTCTHVVTAALIWRRSRLAGPAFLAAMGFVVLLLWFILPGHQLRLPLLGVTFLFAFLGYRYLRKAGEVAVRSLA
jgi:hypothetical protein